ncbi:hypothetical protein [Oceanidesulfovibrio marinus]|uniref:Uncharacterized protein n=1 Tax=Oceanidesulfovibrio marinus TaxID=370038 RepID=A0A6P1ZIS0_9BACT|nr:hypothetical protein [Oceanidesulfovibrio marinus]QJT07861.1 hypothetical protein E8L03_02480 [Oceanidesulfovibrio marinus]TVM33358.1 hypothetical protein DQK91_11875 [Oceanidesulfovibrio marinus]
MRIPTSILITVLMILWALSIAGCDGVYRQPANAEVASVPYNEQSLWNLYRARDYMAQGRYEIAREHLALARSSARTQEMQQLLDREMASVNAAIRSRR